MVKYVDDITRLLQKKEKRELACSSCDELLGTHEIDINEDWVYCEKCYKESFDGLIKNNTGV